MTSTLPLPIGPLTPRLEVVPVDGLRSVFLNGYLVARYPCDDKGTERVVVSQLAEVLPLPDRQIAAAFGPHALSRFRSQARHGGAAALMPRKTGPHKPHKMTPRFEQRSTLPLPVGEDCLLNDGPWLPHIIHRAALRLVSKRESV